MAYLPTVGEYVLAVQQYPGRDWCLGFCVQAPTTPLDETWSLTDPNGQLLSLSGPVDFTPLLPADGHWWFEHTDEINTQAFPLSVWIARMLDRPRADERRRIQNLMAVSFWSEFHQKLEEDGLIVPTRLGPVATAYLRSLFIRAEDPRKDVFNLLRAELIAGEVVRDSGELLRFIARLEERLL